MNDPLFARRAMLAVSDVRYCDPPMQSRGAARVAYASFDPQLRLATNLQELSTRNRVCRQLRSRERSDNF